MSTPPSRAHAHPSRLPGKYYVIAKHACGGGAYTKVGCRITKLTWDVYIYNDGRPTVVTGVTGKEIAPKYEKYEGIVACANGK